MNKEPISYDQFRSAVKWIDGNRRFLEEVKADAEFLRALEAIVRHLNRLAPSQQDRLLGIRDAIKKSQQDAEARAAAAAEMSLSQVEKILEDQRSSRATLEAIAVGRFKMPKGSIKSVGGMDHLRELISTFVSNEHAHKSITEVANEGRSSLR